MASVPMDYRTNYSREQMRGVAMVGPCGPWCLNRGLRLNLSFSVTAAGAAVQQVVDQATDAGQKGLVGLGSNRRAGG